ncbi:M20/M25/M40 family metallo-hydrolase [Aporhodopirellula aestuarii]|uniref:M20/M25/M40 family metallo-hydrolase n=1 Tax=Aporhodopirellula aestuarii TaxID=2950107 RepID=A0ABT0TXG4_9BACT|nr:M20/M25/M40 family metallo-hydrolase [Aporhodopirellula aestuarii]MCM2369292.1 M20/M25/M40 family metallo-hydrolase [Aporhodopirellula aestuarii]
MLTSRFPFSAIYSVALATAFVANGGLTFAEDNPAPAADDSVQNETLLLSNTRKLTFEGRRAGEGYFSADGSQMVFQSERDAANPFYQIYLTDLETGDIRRVSPGMGKTTCAWIHPDGDKVLFASTHGDGQSEVKQQEEIALRESGKQRRYSWDYDPSYELYAADLDQIKDGTTDGLTRLTNAEGYDAEGSYSPNGKQIVFASNREAYLRELTPREKELFDRDPAFMIDLYLMNADGSPLPDGRSVRRLTDEPGYDGGPFFSPDGQRICWRRFSPDGATAEIFTMNVDGSDVKRLTSLNAMSWAPFFHPSGDYLIFTTNRHGFANFELYLVRADGEGEPVRVTTTPGFDGLPVFLPSGDQLSWTSNRVLNADGTLAMEDDEPKQGTSQIYLADFDDAKARELLGLTDSVDDSGSLDAALALKNVQATAPEYRPSDVMRHVDYLTREELAGRMTGTEGERRATAYVAAYLESLGFRGAGENGSFYQTFEFPAGSSLGESNQAVMKIVADEKGTHPSSEATLELGEEWTPLSFSQTGEIEPAEVVFAGYGLQIQGTENHEQYDSYVHLDVLDKWVMVLRDVPQDITPETRQWMARYGSPRRKATTARDLGARGILFVSGPTSKVNRELIRFDRTASQAEVSIAAVSINNEVASKIISRSGEDLAELQKSIDDGSLAMGFAIEGVTLGANIEIVRQTGTGRNVIARLPAQNAVSEDASNDEPTYPFVMVGAHVDHLGRGGSSNSLARDDEEGQIHYGADDNASGVAAMLEIAQSIASERRSGKLKMKRDLVVAAWSGEELGLFGSQYFVEKFADLFPDAPEPVIDEQAAAIATAHGMTPDAAAISPAIGVYLNLDMVGRLDKKLIVQGIGSSPGFEGEVGRRNVPVGLPLQLDKASTGLPTDASAFVARGVPILSAFTGAHEDYHTPRDTADKLNYDAAAKIARLFGLLTRGFLTADQPPAFELNEGDARKDQPRVALRAYLGTIPDYAAGEVKGQRLSGVTAGAPAAEAGMRGGDIVVRVAGRVVEDINDYTYAIEALKIGEPVTIEVVRDGETLQLQVTPGSRD